MAKHFDKRIVALLLIAVAVAFMAYRTYLATPIESPVEPSATPLVTTPGEMTK